jgi:hypothetical protein
MRSRENQSRCIYHYSLQSFALNVRTLFRSLAKISSRLGANWGQKKSGSYEEPGAINQGASTTTVFRASRSTSGHFFAVWQKYRANWEQSIKVHLPLKFSELIYEVAQWIEGLRGRLSCGHATRTLDPFELEVLALLERAVVLTPVELGYLEGIEGRG